MVRLEELQVLQDVPVGNEFKLNDGSLISSITQLYQILPKMGPETFYSHVTADKNDFGNWIRGVQRDYALANMLNPMMRQKDCLDAISRRIYDLEKATESANKNFKKPEIPIFEQRPVMKLPDSKGLHAEIIAKRPVKLPDPKKLYEDIIKKRKVGPTSQIEISTMQIDDPETAEAKIGLLADETGELILTEGGEDLLRDIEKPKLTDKVKSNLGKANEVVAADEFVSDMKKVFTIKTKHTDKKKKIDDLKRVLDYDEE